jgi:methyl-galactoside transport system substrate-binding protein
MRGFTALVFFGCLSIFQAYATESKAVGCIDVFYNNANDPFVSSFDDSLKAQSLRYGKKVRSFDAQGHEELQMQQYLSVSSDKCMKIVSLANSIYSQPLVSHAREQGQTIVFFNGKPDAEAMVSYDRVWYVGSNPMEIGESQGKMVAEYISAHPDYDRNHNDRLDIILLKGPFNDYATEFRSQRVIEELRQAQIKYERVATISADWSFESAYEQMQSYIQKNGLDNVDVIISNNDSMALGALQALQMNGYNLGRGYKKIPIFGVDSIPEALSAVHKGLLEGTVSHDYRTMARICLEIGQDNEVKPDTISKIFKFPIHDNYIMVPSNPNFGYAQR